MFAFPHRMHSCPHLVSNYRPCLYRWLEPGMQPDERASLGLMGSRMYDSSRRACPVCKAPCSVPTLVPVYVRSHFDQLSATTENMETEKTANTQMQGSESSNQNSNDENDEKNDE